MDYLVDIYLIFDIYLTRKVTMQYNVRSIRGKHCYLYNRYNTCTIQTHATDLNSLKL